MKPVESGQERKYRHAKGWDQRGKAKPHRKEPCTNDSEVNSFSKYYSAIEKSETHLR